MSWQRWRRKFFNFIAVIEPILGNDLYLYKQNYPVNRNAPKRTVQFSFLRSTPEKKEYYRSGHILFNVKDNAKR